MPDCVHVSAHDQLARPALVGLRRERGWGSRHRLYRLPTGEVLHHSAIMENFVCLRHISGIILHLLQDLDRYSRSPKQQDLPPCPALKALSKPFPTTATNKPAIINVALNLNFNMGAMDKSAPHQAFRHTPSYLSHLLARWACAYAKITTMPWLP